jgi:hypothetical protein
MTSTTTERLQQLGHGELRPKALHQARTMPTMSVSSDVAPLVGGITEELLHLPRWFESRFLWVKT